LGRTEPIGSVCHAKILHRIALDAALNSNDGMSDECPRHDRNADKGRDGSIRPRRQLSPQWQLLPLSQKAVSSSTQENQPRPAAPAALTSGSPQARPKNAKKNARTPRTNNCLGLTGMMAASDD